MVDLTADDKTASATTVVNNEAYDEALSALIMLGFQKGASEKVLKKIFKEDPDLRVEEVIRIALKQL